VELFIFVFGRIGGTTVHIWLNILNPVFGTALITNNMAEQYHKEIAHYCKLAQFGFGPYWGWTDIQSSFPGPAGYALSGQIHLQSVFAIFS